MNNQIVTIWDSDDLPPGNYGTVYCWNGYTETQVSRSLLRYVDENANRLRAKYLAWIHDLGDTNIKGKRLIDHLASEDGLSYWWVTLLAEKSPFKSPVSYAIRILALEEIIIKESFSRVKLFSSNKNLHKCIALLCKTLEISYVWKRVPSIYKRVSLRTLYNRLPNIVQALAVFIKYIFTCSRVKKLNDFKWFEGDNVCFFCSYFINLDQKSCSQGFFYSNHWESLPTWLHKRGYNTNWIHHYIKSDAISDAQFAVNWVNRFNQEPDKNGHHAFLETFLSFGVLYSVFIKWLGLLILSFHLSKLQEAIQTRKIHVPLWILMKNDWYQSIRGSVAVSNLFWIRLFDKAMSKIPHQRLGLYLCENQAWERAFIHAWKKHGHGRLIAVAHSTVRFWDTRYFLDPCTYQRAVKNGIPLPDVMAVNGPAAYDAYKRSGAPVDNVTAVEALRYLYLADFNPKPNIRVSSDNSLHILVLCDYSPEFTSRQIQLLADAKPLLPRCCAFIVKPHPACPVRSEDYPSLEMKITSKPLPELLNCCDVAYTSNTTSAAVDAYCSGLPLVSVLENAELNMSPLRDHEGVIYVSNPEELAKALYSVRDGKRTSIEPYFFLDKMLPRWENLLISNRFKLRN